jgi:deazaflavin-dependent oxidoreductase (nitroreductase family)
MGLSEKPIDSPVDWVAEHTREYIETDGEEGHIWRGVPTLALTTVGRRSGQPRRTMLIYGEDNGNYVIVASRGGAPTHPLWYLNLVEQPEVEVQIKADRFRARTRTATGEERARLWDMMAEIWPAYNDYQTKTEREIPVVVLERL